MIRSARPLKPAQETMLAVIAMRPGRPDKAEILAAIKALDDEEAQAAPFVKPRGLAKVPPG